MVWRNWIRQLRMLTIIDRCVSACGQYYFITSNMDPCSLRRLKISGQDTMTWSWRSRDWTRRWSVSAGELANSMNETFELSSLFHSDFLMKIERRCRSYGDSTRTSSVLRFVFNDKHFTMKTWVISLSVSPGRPEWVDEYNVWNTSEEVWDSQRWFQSSKHQVM